MIRLEVGPDRKSECLEEWVKGIRKAKNAGCMTLGLDQSDPDGTVIPEVPSGQPPPTSDKDFLVM